jgi:hypothetical protein
MTILEQSYHIDIRPRDVGDNKWIKTLNICIEIYNRWLNDDTCITTYIAENRYDHNKRILE